MTARKAATPKVKAAPVRVTYCVGALTLDCEVSPESVSATIDAYVKIHRLALKRHPDLLPELGPVTSSMVIAVDEGDDEFPSECSRPRRAGFQS